MIWTPEEVAEARKLSMWRFFDEAHLVRADNVERFVKEIMFREFRNALHTLFLDADPHDVQIVSMPEPLGLGAQVRADWNPGQCPVEFVGGPAHGWDSRHHVDPKEAPVIRTPVFSVARMSTRAKTPAVHLPVANYRPWGWNPTTRAWVYTYEGMN